MSNLDKKIKFAISLIQSASKMAEKVGQPLEVCYSGGKDSDVILELTKMAGVKYRAIYKNTTIDPPGTIRHALDMGCEMLRPKMNFRQIIEKKGVPSRFHRFCCEVLKEYKVLDYAIVGIRREESRKRSERYQEPEQCRVYNAKEKARQYFPILEWTCDDVANFVEMRGVRCHPLYYDENGKFDPTKRLGCMCCPMQSRKKRIEEFKAHPKILKLYCDAAERYMETHPKRKQKVGNPYIWMFSEIFCDNATQVQEAKYTLFGETDFKELLENYFNVRL